MSIRNLNLIAFIRLEESRIVWSWGPGDLQGQHNPNLLANGNILLFDNGGERGWSRALEMDPRTKTRVWEYHADPKPSFFSHCCGSVQELPNGNVVITNAQQGHVFEVTRDKRVVWEYWNSYLNQLKRKRVSIFRSQRVPRERAFPSS